jgi:serine protease inhibitor
MSPKVPQLIFATAVIVALAALVSGKSEAQKDQVKETFRFDTNDTKSLELAKEEQRDIVDI